MSSPSFSSELSDFNFNHSPTGPLSSGILVNLIAVWTSLFSTISPHQIIFYLIFRFMRMMKFSWRLSEEELIPLPLHIDMLDENMSSDAGGSLSLSISFTDSSRHGLKEELDTNDPSWEFIDEPKHPQKKEETEENSVPDDEGEDEKISDEQDDEENEHDESAYDGDDDKD